MYCGIVKPTRRNIENGGAIVAKVQRVGYRRKQLTRSHSDREQELLAEQECSG